MIVGCVGRVELTFGPGRCRNSEKYGRSKVLMMKYRQTVKIARVATRTNETLNGHMVARRSP